jgi:hypothetical protein
MIKQLNVPLYTGHESYDRARKIERIVCEQYCDEDTDAADLAAAEIAEHPEYSDDYIAMLVAQRLLQP